MASQNASSRRVRTLAYLVGILLFCCLASRSAAPEPESAAARQGAWAIAATLEPTAAPTVAPTPAPTAAQTPAPTASPEPFGAETVVVTSVFVDAEGAPEPDGPAEEPAAEPAAAPFPAADPTSPPLCQYQTDSVRIEIREYALKNVVYFAAEIWLTDPKQLQSAFSSNKFNAATESVEDIAARNGAILAINGDFATFNEGGVILRNGEVYRKKRSTRALLVIDRNGDFIPSVEAPKNPDEAAAAFLADGVWQTLVFGPVLIDNGEAVPLPAKFFISTEAREPRTAIAQLGPLHYLWVVVDGRQDEYSQGVSLSRLQEILLGHGAVTAFNLDGGGSSTMYFNGNIINRPANGGQRKVPDVLFIGK